MFWELTTVFSFVLIGHNPERQANRRAAVNALIVTTLGGLAMLVGFILLGHLAGTYLVDEVMASAAATAPTGLVVTAVLLVLAGAVSKSALVPFHFWLPGAMAAPTPVSAYLHAAAMVKAGIFLVALLAPAYAATPGWRPVLIVLGVATMILGGLRALRQSDVKLLLAYGTVSQLGFLMTVVGLGTRAAALAGVAMVVAHALFKATLFMVVGIVDHHTHTRDLRKLTGLRRAMPWLCAWTVLAAASMAGIPPLFGFVAKEAVYTAFVDVATSVTGDGTGIGTAASWLVIAGLVTGSLLTMAYTLRFVWGVYGDKPGADALEVEPVPWPFAAPVGLLALLGLGLAFLGGPLATAWEGYTDQFPVGDHPPYLALWHGLTPALGLSAVAVLGGIVLFWWLQRRAAVSTGPAGVTSPAASTWPAAPAWMPDAQRGFEASLRATDRLAVEVTGRTQRGSLPFYLGSILVVVLLVPGVALVQAGWPNLTVVWADSAAQAVVAAIMVAAALLTVRSRRRLKAVLLAGVTGYATAMLFLLHGAPDLALTQVLVETVTLVLFVLVLRRLGEYFSARPFTRSRTFRVVLGTLAGCFAAGLAGATASARVGRPVSDLFAQAAVDYGGGRNIVNVTLVDIRAWDTMGELSVLCVAATGVASLTFLITGRGGVQSPAAPLDDAELHERALAAGAPVTGVVASVTEGGAPVTGSGMGAGPQSRPWLRASRALDTRERSIIFEIVTRLVFHTVIVFSVWLLFAGHNGPGGGFAGGLMAGLALMIRYLAGGRFELDEAAPVDAGRVLGLGLVTATLSAVAPLFFGGQVLQSAIVDLHLPLVGDVHVVTSLFFDIGVYLVVVGLMLDVLRSLGGGIDAQLEGDTDDVDPLPGSYPDRIGSGDTPQTDLDHPAHLTAAILGTGGGR